MLIAPHLLFARMKRQKAPLYFLTVQSTEMVQSVLQAAAQAEQSCGIIIPSTTLSVPLDSLIHWTLTEAARSSQSVAVIVRTGSTELQVQRVLAAGAPALWVEFAGNDSFETIRQQSEKIAATAHLQAKDVIIEVPRALTFSRLESLVRGAAIQALALPPLSSNREQQHLSLTQLQEISKLSRLPLILPAESLSKYWTRKSLAAGVVGFKLEEQIEKSYLAGAQVGVRELQGNYSRFTRYPTKAVQKVVESYLTLFK